ncbi:MAG: glycosyltransferase family 39 protein [Candidatus Micrarchaeales archaeon]
MKKIESLKKLEKSKKLNWFCLFLIILLSSFLSTFFFHGVVPSSGADTYLYSQYAYDVETKGIKSLLNRGVLSVKFILIYGIAFFYKIFGPSMFSSSLFTILCFLFNIIVIYLIGKELYNEKAGLLAAFLFGIFPLAVTQASLTSDNTPMALFASLSIFFIVKALKENKKIFYFLSTFVAIIGVLCVWEEIVIMLPLIFILLIDIKEKGLKNIKNYLFSLFGVMIGFLLIMLIGYIHSNDFLYVLEQAESSYDECWGDGCVDFPNFSIFKRYLEILLPFNFISTIMQFFATRDIDLVFSLIDPFKSIEKESAFLINYYFYFFIFFLLVLMFLKEKRIYIPAIWVFLSLLYLSFGTRSLKRYIMINVVYPRFTLIFFPGVMLIVSFGIIKILEISRSKIKRLLAILFSIFVLAFLFFESIYSVIFIEYSWYEATYPFIQIGEFISSLPTNSTVYREMDVPIDVYAHYSQNFYNIQNLDCKTFIKRSYIVLKENESFQKECNLSLAFVPRRIPKYWVAEVLNITNKSLYKNIWDFQKYVVYSAQ